MAERYDIEAANGVSTIPYSSHAMDRVVSISYHQTPTSGTVSVTARPFGRADFIPIEGAGALPATAETSFSVSYPIAELRIEMTGVIGGTRAYITIADVRD